MMHQKHLAAAVLLAFTAAMIGIGFFVKPVMEGRIKPTIRFGGVQLFGERDDPPPSANADYWDWCVRAVDAGNPGFDQPPLGHFGCRRYNDCYSIIASDPSVTPESVRMALDSSSPGLANPVNYLLYKIIADQCVLKTLKTLLGEENFESLLDKSE